MTEGFDLHAALQNRGYATTHVSIWLEEQPWYELQSLEKKQARIPDAADPELKKIEDRIAEVKREIDATEYKVGIRGISRRAAEDLISKAISTFPYKRNMYGHDDDKQALDRVRYIRELSFAHHISTLENPDGAVIEFTEENRDTMARMLLGEAPESAVSTIEAAIGEVSKNFTETQAKHQSPDFS